MSNPLKIVVLPGDHIGPEITAAAVAVLQAVDARFGLRLQLEPHVVGHSSLRTHGVTITDDVYEAAAQADAILLGPCDNGGYPSPDKGGLNVPGKLRHGLDLYANIRPSRAYPSLPLARPGLDVLMVRENTEGFYPDRNMFEGYGEVMPVEGVAISMRKITRARIQPDRARRVRVGSPPSQAGHHRQQEAHPAPHRRALL